MTQTLIKTRIKNFRYKETADPILKDISLEIFRREIVCVTGPNGAGKTTFLKIISGLLPTAEPGDKIYIDGVGELASMKPPQIARIISWMPSETKIAYDYEVFETVLMGRLPYVGFFSSPAKDDIDKTSRALAMTGLTGFSRRKISTLSSGERQLVYLAQAIAQDTPVMILDEPATHLDIKHSAKIFSILKMLSRQNGKTIIFSHHDLNTAAFFSTRIIMIKNGAVLSSGAPREVINEENVNLLYSLTDDDEIKYNVIYSNIHKENQNTHGGIPVIFPSPKNNKEDVL